MYLGQQIDDILSSKKNLLIGSNTPFYIVTILNKAFKKTDIPVSFKYERFNDYYKSEFSIGGVYDSNEDKCFVVLYFSKHKKFKLTKHLWKDFKFGISQTCQHEIIHKIQNQFRDDDVECDPVDFRLLTQGQDGEDREYLSNLDEIDAYAHDIAMEIKRYYPFSDPYSILQNISKRKRIDAFQYYLNTFEGEDWVDIKKLLLKKTYKWLPYVTYSKD